MVDASGDWAIVAGSDLPQTKLTSPDFGYAGPLAFFPGATGTGLFSAAQP